MNVPRILVIGDSYMNAAVFTAAFAERGITVDSATVTVADSTWGTSGITEFEGDPAEVAMLAQGYEIVAFHGAPFTAEVLAKLPELQFAACARGGPVNVDLAAAARHNVRVTTTPGKNAEAVADLTIGFLIALARNVPASVRDVEERVEAGRPVTDSNFEGARWFGREVASLRVGLVGYGNVARLVAARARALGASVLAYDPYVDPASVSEVEIVATLGELLQSSDVLSVHARATSENRHMIDAAEIAQLPRSAYLINTARETLVNEKALLNALQQGQLAGVALDVNEQHGPWPELVGHPKVILTPHIGGATLETLKRGANMVVEEIERFLANEPLRWEV